MHTLVSSYVQNTFMVYFFPVFRMVFEINVHLV